MSNIPCGSSIRFEILIKVSSLAGSVYTHFDASAGLYGVSGGSRLKFNFRTRDISVGFGKPDSLSCCWDGQLFFWTFVIIFFTEPAQFFFLNGTFYRMLLPETREKLKYVFPEEYMKKI